MIAHITESLKRNRRTAQSSMSAASQIGDAILEKRITDGGVFWYMVGATTDHGTERSVSFKYSYLYTE